MNTLKLVTLQYLISNLILKVIIHIQLPALYQIIINQKSLKLQYTFKQYDSKLGWQKRNLNAINTDISLANTETKHYEKFKPPLIQITQDITNIVLSSMGDRS